MTALAEENVSHPSRLSGVKILLFALAVLLAVTWIATYSITKQESEAGTGSTFFFTLPVVA